MMKDGVKWRRELQVSQIPYYKRCHRYPINKITFAPGEGNKPLGIFMDKGSEFLSFPTIYCAKTRPDNKAEQNLFIPVQYVTGNSEVKIEG